MRLLPLLVPVKVRDGEGLPGSFLNRQVRQLMQRFADRSFRWLTSDPLERRNVAWFMAGGVLMSCGLTFSTGPVLQAFLLHVGLNTRQLGRISFVAQIASAVGMFAFMGLADRARRRARAVTVLALAASATPVVLYVLSILPVAVGTVGLVFGTMLVVQAVQLPIESLRTMIRSGLLVRALRPEIRGRFSSISGLIGGSAVLLMSFVAARLLRLSAGFAVCFMIATGLAILGALTIRHLRELPALDKPGRAGSASPLTAAVDVLGLKEFRVLLLPNLLRGVAFAPGGFLMVIAAQRLAVGRSYAGYLGAAGTAAGPAGSFAMGWAVDRYGPGRVILVGALLCALGAVALAYAATPVMFLAACVVYSFGGTLVGSAVPLGTYSIAPPGMVGAFNGGRLLLLSVSGASGALLVGRLLSRGSVGARPVLLGSAVLLVVLGLLYWYGFPRRSSRS